MHIAGLYKHEDFYMKYLCTSLSLKKKIISLIKKKKKYFLPEDQKLANQEVFLLKFPKSRVVLHSGNP